MSDSFSSQVTQGIELCISAIGLVLLWHFYLSAKARANPVPSALPVWIIRTSEFFVFLCFVCAGAFLSSIVFTLLAKVFIKDVDAYTIVAGAGFDPGIILGVFLFIKYYEKPAPTKPLPVSPVNPIKAGLVTFLIALPLVFLTGLVWQALLRILHLPIEQQDAVERLIKSKDPLLVTVILIIAVGLAPIAEEYVFRFGLFRFARVRLPGILAILLPAVAFGLVHVNLASFASLTVLAIVLSVAYERTGKISVPIIAHALFNLNAIVMILSGIKS